MGAEIYCKIQLQLTPAGKLASPSRGFNLNQKQNDFVIFSLYICLNGTPWQIAPISSKTLRSSMVEGA